MSKYEYIIVDISWKKDMVKELNKLGQKGWELLFKKPYVGKVSAFKGYDECYFKRKIVI